MFDQTFCTGTSHLLFLVYIKDLTKISTKLFTLMFADDASIFIHGSDLYMMEETLNDEMKKSGYMAEGE